MRALRKGSRKTHVMVQRYAHLSPDHMKAAIERLATSTTVSGTGTNEAMAVVEMVSARNRMVSRPGLEPGTPCLKVRAGGFGRSGTNNDGVSRRSGLAARASRRSGLG